MAKKALLIGINYTGTPSALNGCVNDVSNMKEYLLERGYSASDIKILTDETGQPPTRANILRNLMELITSDAETLFFHYSGHGSFVPDTDGDEEDGRDECIIPIDYTSAGVILDDEIKGIVQCICTDQSLTAILDCCHSGSGMDLCYNMYERGGRFSIFRDKKQAKTRGQVVMISGCQDRETSSDAFISGQYQGALTNAFLRASRRNNRLSYEELMREIRSDLKKSGYSQIPCLSAGKELNLKAQLSV